MLAKIKDIVNSRIEIKFIKRYYLKKVALWLINYDYPKIQFPTVRLSMLTSIFLFSLIIFLFAGITYNWSDNSKKLLQMREIQAEEKIVTVHLKDIKLKSQQYVRIYEALKFLTFGKMNKEQLKIVTDELWIISRQLNFDPLLILALVSVESQGNPNVQGRYRSGETSGAYGLMQIKVGTAKFVAKKAGYKNISAEDLMDPETNLIVGTHYLIKLIYTYKSVRLGIIAYNIGPGALNRKLRNHTDLSYRYYNRTLSNYEALVDRFGENPTM